MDTNTITLKLPRVYVQDWMLRTECEGATMVKGTWKSREWTVTLDPEATADLIDDCKHYTSDVMLSDFWDSCRGVVLSARATLKRLEDAGLL